jgi:hypothetical protein
VLIVDNEIKRAFIVSNTKTESPKTVAVALYATTTTSTDGMPVA